jgi:hypothetical protein
LRTGLNSRGVFSEDNCQSLTEVPVDVTVKEPRAGVVSSETESNVSRVDSDNLVFESILMV